MKGDSDVRNKIFVVLIIFLLSGGMLVTVGAEPRDANIGSNTPILLDVAPSLSLNEVKTPSYSNLTAIRDRPIEVNPLLKCSEELTSGSELQLNLFDDADYTAKIDEVTTSVEETTSIRGSIKNFELGYFVLSTTDGRTLGRIEIPEERETFSIKPIEDSQAHNLLEIDRQKSNFLPSGGAMEPPSLSDQNLKDSEPFGDNSTPTHESLNYDNSSDMNDVSNNVATNQLESDPYEQVTVDVMVVYTPNAKDWASDNEGSIDNVIDQAMYTGNEVLENSKTYLDINLVHSAEVDYEEADDGQDSRTDLERLTDTDDGHMEEVHDWRDEYNADLVALFAEVHDVGGIAWLLRVESGWPSYGFSLTRVQQASDSYTHIHELGHNMGLHHHKEQNQREGPGLYDYSAGWRDPEKEICTVMTYEDGDYFDDGKDTYRIPFFSNPNIEYEGVPIGDPDDADNARTVREMKHEISDYRKEEYHLIINAEEGGTTDPAPDTYIYEKEDVVIVEATPNEGWYFERWKGDYNGTEEKITIEMNSDMEITAHFSEIPTYELDIEIEGKGEVEIEPEKDEYEEGTEVDLTAESAEYWEFLEWKCDYEGSEEEIKITMDSDKTITAVFEEFVKYNLIVGIEGEGSTDPPKGNHTYYDGENVEVKAEPAEGWQFVNWTGDFESEEEEINIKMHENKTITTRFAEIPTYELTIEIEGEGEVEIEPEQYEYEEGTEVDLRAEWTEGWSFKGWTGDYEGSEDQINITMNGDKNITAIFEELSEYNLTILIEGEGATYPPEGTYTYYDGTEVHLSPTPEEGWYFAQWRGYYIGTRQEITIEMDRNKSITAVFEQVVKCNLTIEIEGEGSTDPSEGTYTYNEGEFLIIRAVEDIDGWKFVEWRGDYTGKEKEIRVAIDRDKTITAVFEKENYDLIVDLEGMGSVNIYPEQDEYEHGEKVDLTAEPAEDWEFTGWRGDYQGSEDEITLIMDSDKNITAVFEELGEYDLRINIEGGGFTDPPEGTHTYYDGTKVNLSPTAEEGWYFDFWTGDYEGEEEEVNIKMDENKTITAHFAEIPTYELTIEIEGEGEVRINPEQYEYEEGMKLNLTAEPAHGWAFNEWTGDYEGSEDEIRITMNEDKNVTALFIEIPRYNLMINIEGKGEVEIEPEQDEYEEGAKVNLTAEPEKGWEFGEWIGDINDTGEEIRIVMDDNKTITANFEPAEAQLEEGEEDETPGFTSTLLLLALVMAVKIYKKKKR